MPLDLHELLRDTSREEIDRLLTRSFLANPVETSIIAFLIQDGARRGLVDTGADELFEPGLGSKLPASLAAVGYFPDQVNDVQITHVHSDHSGALVVGGKLWFPTATVHVACEDADFFLDPSNAEPTGNNRRSLEQAEKTLEPPCVSTVKRLGQYADPTGDHARKSNASHPSSSWEILS